MSTHVEGLTIEALATAQMRACTVMHSVELVDDRAHVVATVDAKGHVVVRPEESPHQPLDF